MRDINVDIQSFCFEDVNLSDEVHLIIIHCIIKMSEVL